jgi:excisionase family DNA binding protein
MAGDYKVLTVKEVSEMLHVHPSTIYKLTKSRKIPKLSNRLRLAIPNGRD